MTYPKPTPRPTGARSLFLSTACGLLAAAWGATAFASSGMGVIGMPDRAEREPSADAATRVRLSGIFSVGAQGTDPCYTEPQCGTLYYACPAGKEALCRMEWDEIATAAAAGKCVTFGSTRTDTGTPQNNGRLRAAGTALGEPDPYPLGMGVREVDCAKQDLSCSTTPDLVAARAQKCAASPGDGGTGAVGGGTGGQAGASSGSGGSPAGTGGGSGGAAATGGGSSGAAGADGGAPMARGSSSGCMVAAGGGGGGALLALLLGAATMVRARRPRSGRAGRSDKDA